jgi:hypothetical protein
MFGAALAGIRTYSPEYVEVLRPGLGDDHSFRAALRNLKFLTT